MIRFIFLHLFKLPVGNVTSVGAVVMVMVMFLFNVFYFCIASFMATGNGTCVAEENAAHVKLFVLFK